MEKGLRNAVTFWRTPSPSAIGTDVQVKRGKGCVFCWGGLSARIIHRSVGALWFCRGSTRWKPPGSGIVSWILCGSRVGKSDRVDLYWWILNPLIYNFILMNTYFPCPQMSSTLDLESPLSSVLSHELLSRLMNDSVFQTRQTYRFQKGSTTSTWIITSTKSIERSLIISGNIRT